MSSSERALRAERRRGWPGGLVGGHAPAQLDTAEARLASMWQLALDAWSLTGAPLPTYDRSTMPGRLIRP